MFGSQPNFESRFRRRCEMSRHCGTVPHLRAVDNTFVLGRMLARTVLVLDEHRRGPDFEETVHPAVNIELKGMVREMRQKIFIDQVTLAEQLGKALEAVASEASVEKAIADAISSEMDRFKVTLRAEVRKYLDKILVAEIESQIGNSARSLAGNIVEKVWSNLVKSGK